jgi:flagellar hook-basal body complex protein FliE
MRGVERVTGTSGALEPAASRQPAKQKGFVDTLAEAIRQVDQNIKAADRAAEAFASGANGNIHEVMIIAEKAELSLRLASAIRNKLLEAYREIMRMQV